MDVTYAMEVMEMIMDVVPVAQDINSNTPVKQIKQHLMIADMNPITMYVLATKMYLIAVIWMVGLISSIVDLKGMAAKH